MKIGIGSYAYGWNIQRGMTAEQLLDHAIEVGADVVQVCDNLPLFELDWTTLSSKATDHGIILQVGNIGTPGDLIRTAEIAGKIKSPIIRFVIGPAFATQSAHEVADDFRDAARICSENGARLAIENQEYFRAPQFAEIVSLIGHGAAITLDTANSLANLEGTECLIKYLADLSICLHAKDVAVEREFHMFGFRVFGVPAGQGAVDFHLLKQSLPKLESVILEQWVPTVNNQPPTTNEVEMVAPGLNYLRSIWKD